MPGLYTFVASSTMSIDGHTRTRGVPFHSVLTDTLDRFVKAGKITVSQQPDETEHVYPSYAPILRLTGTPTPDPAPSVPVAVAVPAVDDVPSVDDVVNVHPSVVDAAVDSETVTENSDPAVFTNPPKGNKKR